MQKINAFALLSITMISVLILHTSCTEKERAIQKGESTGLVNPKDWPSIKPLPLDPKIEAQIDDILPKLTLEQKVGQVIQADNASITPEEVKQYRLGSVLSGGNSAPGPLPYADTKTWLEMADAYYLSLIHI